MIVYASRTGNVKSIVDKLSLPNVDINLISSINEPYFIFTYTDGLGEIPKVVDEFLMNNVTYCKGVISSGNTNWGNNYCASADKVNKKYSVPIIHKIDVRGQDSDYELIKEKYLEVIRLEKLFTT